MNTTESQIEKKLIYPSPFHLEEGWNICIENQNKNCTHNEIDQLTMKGLLSYTDFEILKLLAACRYVNTHNLEFALRQSLPECYLKSDYQKNLRKLVHAGLLLKHCLCLHTETKERMDIVSPLRFYSLSPGACSYIEPLVESPCLFRGALPDYAVMEHLASSQLLIRFQASYKHAIKACYRNVRKKVGVHAFVLDALIRYLSCIGESPQSVTLFLLCGRSHTESTRSLISRIHLLFRWLEQHHGQYGQHMIIILLEHFKEIPNIFHNVAAHNIGFFHYPLYFALDTDLLAFPLFECLYRCSDDGSSDKCMIDRVQITL